MWNCLLTLLMLKILCCGQGFYMFDRHTFWFPFKVPVGFYRPNEIMNVPLLRKDTDYYVTNQTIIQWHIFQMKSLFFVTFVDFLWAVEWWIKYATISENDFSYWSVLCNEMGAFRYLDTPLTVTFIFTFTEISSSWDAWDNIHQTQITCLKWIYFKFTVITFVSLTTEMFRILLPHYMQE
jgi:hypothetical protein